MTKQKQWGKVGFMPTPLVSVIIPTHNRAAMCCEAALSVLKQSFRDFELIVVDDGSTDHTARALQGLKLRYLYQTNQGPSAARNKGIQTGRGKYFCFLDSDDLWEKDKLKNQIQFMERDHVFISFTNETWLLNGRFINQHKKHKKFGGWIFEHCLPLCIISPSSVMIHQTVFEQCGLWDEAMWMCEDYELWLRYSNRYPFEFLDDKLIIKRGGHPGQLSKAFFPIEKYRIEALEKTILSGGLTPRNLKLASSMLEKKCRIYIQGCLKRNKLKEASMYKEKMNRFVETN